MPSGGALVGSGEVEAQAAGAGADEHEEGAGGLVVESVHPLLPDFLQAGFYECELEV